MVSDLAKVGVEVRIPSPAPISKDNSRHLVGWASRTCLSSLSGERAGDLAGSLCRGVQGAGRRQVEQRAPEITAAEGEKPTPTVIDIMAALKESMQARGKVREVVRKRIGKAAP